jgi:hypothetical protein
MYASGATEHEHKDGKAPLSTTAGAPFIKVLEKVYERQKPSPFSMNYFPKAQTEDLPREFPITPQRRSMV